MPGAVAPSVEDVEQVSRLSDPVLRNLWITNHYHRLAVSFPSGAGGGANWCTFAVWASRQAGQTIRGEDVLDVIERRLGRESRLINGINRLWRGVFVYAMEHPESKRARALRIVTAGPLSRASDAVARGNRKVYEEIAREFARFLPLCRNGVIAPNELAVFLAGLRPGDAPEGQDYLRRAFTHYAAALETADPVARAELVLLSNLMIGLHEQTRLQPEILEALEVPFATFDDVGRRLLHVFVPGCMKWHWTVKTPIAVAVGAVARTAGLTLRGATRFLITERMMTLSFPDAMIHLGRDLRGDYPAPLRDPRNADLVELLNRFRPPGHDPNGVGACDWSVLEQRMCLIAQLFRLRQTDPVLFNAPYNADQVTAFEAGRLPEGEL